VLIWAEACSKSRGAERQRGMSGAGAPARHPPTCMTWHAQRSSAHSGTNMCMHLHKNVHTLAQTRAHTGKNTRTYWHKHVHMLAQTRAHAGTNTCTCWHKHVHTLAQTRAHAGTSTGCPSLRKRSNMLLKNPKRGLRLQPRAKQYFLGLGKTLITHAAHSNSAPAACVCCASCVSWVSCTLCATSVSCPKCAQCAACA